MMVALCSQLQTNINLSCPKPKGNFIKNKLVFTHLDKVKIYELFSKVSLPL